MPGLSTSDVWFRDLGLCSPKSPRTQIMGLKGPNTVHIKAFGGSNLIIWVLGPLG